MKPGGDSKNGNSPYHSRFLKWLDARTGLHTLMQTALDEPIPGGARFAYIFGSALIFIFISQVVTGIFLALYYVASADHAHTTVEYMVKEVTGGSFLRSLHSYGSTATIVVLLLHIAQTYLYGAYKGKRELLWMSGGVLGLLMFAMAFTGYLLPWDQKAYFATAVGTNLPSEVPGIGNWLKRFMRGGNEMGTLTVSRFYVAHVFIIPALIVAFLAAHVYLFRKAGAAGPPSADPIKPRMATQPFYPRQVMMDVLATALLIIGIGLASHFSPMELGPKADPTDTHYLPRPEWYYMPMFQWLKYWHGPLTIIGIVVIPTILLLLFFAWPFLDRRPERRPWKRPIAVTLFGVALAAYLGLGIISYLEDLKTPGIATQLRRQREQTERFMKAPFEPELAGPSLAAGTMDPVLAEGKRIYGNESCDVCHGPNGEGTPDGNSLEGIGGKYSGPEIEAMLVRPTPEMVEGGMWPLEIKQQDLQALVAYLRDL